MTDENKNYKEIADSFKWLQNKGGSGPNSTNNQASPYAKSQELRKEHEKQIEVTLVPNNEERVPNFFKKIGHTVLSIFKKQ